MIESKPNSNTGHRKRRASTLSRIRRAMVCLAVLGLLASLAAPAAAATVHESQQESITIHGTGNINSYGNVQTQYRYLTLGEGLWTVDSGGTLKKVTGVFRWVKEQQDGKTKHRRITTAKDCASTFHGVTVFRLSADDADCRPGQWRLAVDASRRWSVTFLRVASADGVVDQPQVPVTPPPPPAASIAGGAGVTEGSDAQFTVTVSPAPASALAVRIEFAQQGDFAANLAARTVTVSSTGTAAVTVATTDDSIDEADGSVTATIAAGSDYTIGAHGQATVAVADNDDPAPPPPPPPPPPEKTEQTSVTVSGEGKPNRYRPSQADWQSRVVTLGEGLWTVSSVGTQEKVTGVSRLVGVLTDGKYKYRRVNTETACAATYKGTPVFRISADIADCGPGDDWRVNVLAVQRWSVTLSRVGTASDADDPPPTPVEPEVQLPEDSEEEDSEETTEDPESIQFESEQPDEPESVTKSGRANKRVTRKLELSQGRWEFALWNKSSKRGVFKATLKHSSGRVCKKWDSKSVRRVTDELRIGAKKCPAGAYTLTVKAQRNWTAEFIRQP